MDRRYREFVAYNRSPGEGEPIWINEMGFATTADKTERDQAYWWAHIGVYEIKDLPIGKDVIGDAKNHYLGLTRTDRTKKLAFYTVAMLKNLLGTVKITPSDADVTVTAISGDVRDLHAHLFRRSDGKQVLFLWKKAGAAIVRARLRRSGRSAVQYDLAGKPQAYSDFEGQTLDRIALSAGNVAIFRIDP